MKNILIAHVIIQGSKPLLWHKFGPESMPLEKQERQGVAGHNPEEWRQTVLVTKNGQLYIQNTYVFRSMRDGAVYTKQGRGNLVKPLSSTLQVLTNPILIDRFFPNFPNGHNFDISKIEPPPQDEEEKVFLDIRGVVNPNTKSRNVRYRIGVSIGWLAVFDLQFDKTIVSRNEVESVLIDTGRLVGIGNGRSIGYGRFEVVNFEINE